MLGAIVHLILLLLACVRPLLRSTLCLGYLRVTHLCHSLLRFSITPITSSFLVSQSLVESVLGTPNQSLVDVQVECWNDSPIFFMPRQAINRLGL